MWPTNLCLSVNKPLDLREKEKHTWFRLCTMTYTAVYLSIRNQGDANTVYQRVNLLSTA